MRSAAPSWRATRRRSRSSPASGRRSRNASSWTSGTSSAPRRSSLAECVGQDRVKEQLDVLLQAARERGEPGDRLLFSGPPGLGKTTLAQIVAHEMSAGFQPTSGPALERPGDLAAILTNLGQGDVLFVDEIHRMPRPVEEVL